MGKEAKSREYRANGYQKCEERDIGADVLYGDEGWLDENGKDIVDDVHSDCRCDRFCRVENDAEQNTCKKPLRKLCEAKSEHCEEESGNESCRKSAAAVVLGDEYTSIDEPFKNGRYDAECKKEIEVAKERSVSACEKCTVQGKFGISSLKKQNLQEERAQNKQYRSI